MEGVTNVHGPQVKRGPTKQVTPTPMRRNIKALMATLDIEFVDSCSLACFAGSSGSFYLGVNEDIIRSVPMS